MLALASCESKGDEVIIRGGKISGKGQAEAPKEKVRRRLAEVPEDFTFVIIADIHLQTNTEHPWNLKFRLAVEKINKINPAFVVLLGDLTAEGHKGNEASRAQYLDLSLLASGLKPVIVPVVGNHDAGEESTGADDRSRPLFLDMESQLKTFSGNYYSFDCGKWHFVILDTGWDGTMSKEQLIWLEKDLAKHRGLPTAASCIST